MPFKFRSHILFVFFTILVMASLSPASAQTTQAVKLRTVVIDPGHGGRHPGTVKGTVMEKDITLSVALKFGKMIKEKYPDIKVIYTRTGDSFVDLDERAKIANKNHADLFISIHVNSTKSTSARGTETFVMGLDKGNANMEVCQLENSVITLEDGYSSKYSGFDPGNPESYIIFSLLQNSHLEQSLILAAAIQENLKKGPIKYDRGVKQAPFLVLWKCTMPSVLVELGFLSNSTDYKELVNKSSHTKMASSLMKAFEQYKDQYETEIEIAALHAPSEEYRIQIMASGKLLKDNAKEFKGLRCSYIRSGNLYKYTYGSFRTKEEAQAALPSVKELFPQAYVIKTEL